ncbi:hypothetical protein BW730_02615 [Tessaracoccus aquimaris]|uniref:Uncharacterized protein n=1 Tax=Tessaracoccus aquimaris TaxID=1332264 RepID=A0A1Q2CKL4_9ACTN|nr:hypothetical protein [Tessaracoccus aquimaris]AQP46590.1 hypothetical protein BW730_02615 [Tessaracoccus aquimaris]
MMFAVSITLLLILVAAAAVFLVVGVSSGHVRVKHQRVEQIALAADQRLNGRGEVPQFLQRLDNRR